jgi:[CysO sulfur-carrier protein]-S-L-cysteine hydrolase
MPKGRESADGYGPRADGDQPRAAGHTHPGPPAVDLSAELRDAMTAHARAELPIEACGLVIGDRPAGEGGRPLRWLSLRNALASPYRYEIDPDDLLRITIDLDASDEVIWAIVHSHVASPARPSATDIRQAFYPEALYILVSLDPAEADPVTGRPSLRAWRIVDGIVHEVEVTPRWEEP